MAWVEKLPGGKYRGAWRTPDGLKVYTKRTTHPEHPYTRKRDAFDAAQEAEVKARRVASVEAGTQSAKMPWGEWWELSKPDRKDSDTASIDADIVKRYVMPKWGSIPLNQISHKAVQRWVTKELSPGKSAKYTRRIYAPFSASVNRAVDEEILTASPCSRIKLPKVPKRTKPHIEKGHLDAIRAINESKGRPYLRDQGHRDLVDVALDAGLRPGELCGLHVHRLDLDSGWLVVAEVLVGKLRVIRPWPKNTNERRVPLTAAAVSILRRRVSNMDTTAGCGLPHTDGSACPSALAFTNERNNPITPHALYQAMQKASREAKVPHKSPYALRRGFATAAGHGGLNAFELAEIMGHADIRETQGYVQETPAARARLRAALGDRDPLTVVPGENTVDTLRRGAVQSEHDGTVDHRTGS
jgi:integrase